METERRRREIREGAGKKEAESWRREKRMGRLGCVEA